LTAGILLLLISGCGASAVRSPAKSVHAGSTAAVTDQPRQQSCASTSSTSSRPSNSASSAGTSGVSTCEYILADGRRFNCNLASLGTSAPTASALERSKACVAITGAIASPGVVKAIDAARTCLTRVPLAVTGGAVPPAGHSPGGPEGELISAGALIAFYPDPGAARRAEPEVLHNVRGFHGVVERRDSVTVLWLKAPVASVRTSVHKCVFT
jgi:hypothetical protein